MSWTPLRQRIDSLPLILAGPILRRTDPDAVTVWVALREACEVKLKVYATDNGESINELILFGSRSTFQIGKYLHVVAVTAKSEDRNYLEAEKIYAYDLEFGDRNLAESLISSNSFPNVSISYFQHQLPTFVMPPDDLNYLRIVHGSCRKPHGGGRDALTILDDLISEYANLPYARPQQLFFTGDQIYGDDVADPLLCILTDAGDTLLGWQENLPIKQHPKAGMQYMNPSEMKPGQRSDTARYYGGFTAMLINKPDKAKSHLFGLGEYFAMYLFAWSPTLWPPELPEPQDIHPNLQPNKLWETESYTIKGFAADIWKVRRSLANIPTYTICDDHDVSDDWYLNREWCDRVLSKPLGRRTVCNALLSYALFQAWGNTPEQFANGNSGEKLLEVAEKWCSSAGNDNTAYQKIVRYLGIPDLDLATNLPNFREDEDNLILNREYPDETKALEWHYTIRSFKHEVIVLDTRTWRGYPKGADKSTDPPMLLSHIAFEEQIKKPLAESKNSNIEATLVVVPTNLVSLKIIDLVQQSDLEKGRVFNSDAGDSWNFHETAFSILLAELFKQRDRIIILSGDIHYSAAVRLSYWCNYHFGETEADRDTPQSAHVLAQLTASAFKNAELSTHIAHTKAKSSIPEKPQYWVGWNEPPQLIEMQVIQETVRLLDVKLPDKKPIVRQINYACGNHEIAWEILIKDSNSLPDWRYRIEWIKRQPAKNVGWKTNQDDPAYSNPPNIFSWLWRNRWVQEGKEVVGYSNIGLVSFEWPPNNDNAKAVIQDIYWHPLWQPNSVVFSRYFVPLKLDEAPPSLRTIESNDRQ